MKRVFIFLFIIISAFANTKILSIEIDNKTSNFNILPKSYILVDYTNSLTLQTVKNLNFKPIQRDTLWFGIVPNTAVWIKFKLKNISSKTIKKIIEYQNPKTEDILLYDGERMLLEGMFHRTKNRYSINPIFTIRLEPHQEKIFYLKAHSKISTLVLKLRLWDEFEFIKYDYNHKIHLFIFFSVITTLLLYNFILFLFTKDVVYLYYVFYLTSIIIVQSLHLGIAQLYLLSNELTRIIINGSFIYISLLIISSIMFVMHFLHTKRFPLIHKFLKFYIVLTLFIALFSYDNMFFTLKILAVYFPLGFLMLYTGFYALKNGNKEAKIYLAGWSFVIVALLFSVLKTLGIYDLTEKFLYINEFAFVLETFVFSIALAYRINLLSEYKRKVDKKLIKLQEKEKTKLQTLVNRQTKDLKNALEEKEILYQELNHRVKNNLQMILSLIKLQIYSSKELETIKDLKITQNRINSITKLYEMLYSAEENNKFTTQKYFSDIIQTIIGNFDIKIKINYDIKYDINISQLVYCGLIINELITNSFKYAFDKKTKNAEISVITYKQGELVYMVIEDNGMGFIDESKESLGLTIVKTLAKKQLHGQIEISSQKGVKVTVKWREKTKS